jgi:hypothetical protein
MTPQDIELLKQVTLLGIYKKESDESLSDVRKSLVDTGMYDKKEAKEIFRMLKDEECITDDSLTLKGITLAKEAEILFKQYG